MRQVCSSSHTRLIYITHHFEEVVPCVSHVLHLSKGGVAFAGAREDYNPKDYT